MGLFLMSSMTMSVWCAYFSMRTIKTIKTQEIYRIFSDFAGVFIPQKHPSGDYVIRECAFKNQQVIIEALMIDS
jgi:hypothetical protein